MCLCMCVCVCVFVCVCVCVCLHVYMYVCLFPYISKSTEPIFKWFSLTSSDSTRKKDGLNANFHKFVICAQRRFFKCAKAFFGVLNVISGRIHLRFGI